MNSYQKLKAKNEKLQNRISELETMIADENQIEMFFVRKTVLIRRDGDKTVWLGETRCDDKSNGGIVGMIENGKSK